jgi:hypothetical protein
MNAKMIKSLVLAATFENALAIRHVLRQPEVLELMAQAHDAEEAACKGEPSPWREDIAGQDAEWKSERRSAMLCALQAVGLA